MKSLADRMIEGLGVRSLRGIYFVPTQDHASLPKCATCAERSQALPKYSAVFRGSPFERERPGLGYLGDCRRRGR
ncbi:MAG: DUF3039 domain-containing protein [Cryobacterium sp.]|nr:DUF3039 domain-containing protein [Cryobacterium sp.]